jgi:hypothetical protein
MAFVVIRDPRLGGHNHPTVVHDHREEAEQEAVRLAEANRGVLFLVADIIGGAELPKEQAKILHYDRGDGGPWDIPF